MNPSDISSAIPILQVEDEQTDIELTVFAFHRSGITNPLNAVTDGQMAIDYLTGEGPFADRARYPVPCLILLDLKLPKLGGLEFLCWLRQQPQFRHIVVIVFSSSDQPHDLEQAYALGANSFIQKPPDLDRYLHLIRLLKSWWLDINRFPPACVKQL